MRLTAPSEKRAPARHGGPVRLTVDTQPISPCRATPSRAKSNAIEAPRRHARENAASIAILILTTGCMVAQLEEPPREPMASME